MLQSVYRRYQMREKYNTIRHSVISDFGPLSPMIARRATRTRYHIIRIAATLGGHQSVL